MGMHPDLARDAWRGVAELWFSDEIHDRFHAACQVQMIAATAVHGSRCASPWSNPSKREYLFHCRWQSSRGMRPRHRSQALLLSGLLVADTEVRP